MKLRTLAIALLAVFVFTAVAFAQNAPRGGMMMMQSWQDIAKQSGLSQTQMDQIEKIAVKYQTDQMTLMQSTVAPQDKQTQMKTLRDKAMDDIKAVLTTDQQAKANDLSQAVLRDQMVRWKAVLSALNVSDAKKTTILGIVKDNQTQTQAIIADKTLDPQTRRQKMMDLHQSMTDQINAQLTPEQQTKLSQMMPMGMGGRPGGRHGGGAPGGQAPSGNPPASQ